MPLPDDQKASLILMIYQQTAMDCGDACFKMICQLLNIGHASKCDDRVLSARDLKERAQGLSLTPCIYRGDVESLKHAKLPVILHWNQQHFVVLYKIVQGKFYIKDPAFGEVVLNQKQFGLFYSGISIEFHLICNMSEKIVARPKAVGQLYFIKKWLGLFAVRKFLILLMVGLFLCACICFLREILAGYVGQLTTNQFGLLFGVVTVTLLRLFGPFRVYAIKHINQFYAHVLFTDVIIKHHDLRAVQDKFVLESNLQLCDQYGDAITVIVWGGLTLLFIVSIFLVFAPLFLGCISILALIWLVLFIKYDRAIQYCRYLVQSCADTISYHAIESKTMLLELFERRSRIQSEQFRLQLQHDVLVYALHSLIFICFFCLLKVKYETAGLDWGVVCLLFVSRYMIISGLQNVFAGMSRLRLLRKNISRYQI